MKCSWFFQRLTDNLMSFNGFTTKVHDLIPLPLNSSDNGIVDEEFTVIMTSDLQTTVIKESDYSKMVSEIEYLKYHILEVGESIENMIHVLALLDRWQDGNSLNLHLCWKEHFKSLTELIKARENLKYIPNSIVSTYLHYICSNVLIDPISEDVIERTIFLIEDMILAATKPSIIEILLKIIYTRISNRQIFTLFNSCHIILNKFSSRKEILSQSMRRFSIKKTSSIYLLLLKYFDLDSVSFRKLKYMNPPNRDVMPFLEIVLPYYRSFLFVPTILDSFPSKEVLFRRGKVNSYLEILDFFIKSSNFNNNFMQPIEIIQRKERFFHKIAKIFFQELSIIKLLLYSLDNNLKYLYEAALIYSEKNSEFYSLIENFLKFVICTDNAFISVHSSLLAVFPKSKLNSEFFDKLLIEVISEKRIFENASSVKSLRRIIRAVESIDENSSYWNASNKLFHIVQTDDHQPACPQLLEAARIFLFKNFNIPFSETSIKFDVAEEADWTDLIGFINMILERECRKINLEHCPKIYYSI